MIRFAKFVLFAALFVSGAAAPAGAPRLDQPQPPPGKRPSPAAIEAWKARKFGMFIHFGLYSTLGGVWKGKEITAGYSEQIQSHAPIPMAEYAPLAGNFNPVKFDPEAIVTLAEQAGMKFIVITSKHHDGFNMFQTHLTDYNIVDATPYGKDVIRQLADACLRHGMKFGVYYSSIDWHFPGATTWTGDNNNPIPETHEDFNVGQIHELVTQYGPLSEIWFDMGKPTPAQSQRFADTVHESQPDCMVSGRVFNSQGDFTVMGDNAVPPYVIDEPWQTPASIYTDTWGYRSWAKRDDLAGKIREHILKLAQVVSRGGNYILNIGPRGDGSIVEFEAEVLKRVGEWLKENGEAIYGSEPQPFRRLDFGYATVKPGKLFLLVRDWPADGRLRLPGLQNRIQRAYFLIDRERSALRIEKSGAQKSVIVRMPEGPDPLVTVVVEYAGSLSVVPPTVPANGSAIVLTEKNADRFLNYNGEGYYAPPTLYKLQWAVALKGPRDYAVAIDFEQPQHPVTVDLWVRDQQTVLTFPAGSGPSSINAGMIKASQFQDHPFVMLKLTPQAPFTKGTGLGVKILQVSLQSVTEP
jgi:alpha-L-fucosidase